MLLLTSCGSEQAGGPAGTTAAASATGTPTASSCGVRPSGTPEATDAPALVGDPAELKRDGVEITGMSGGADACAAFEVTNEGAEPLTYTITFTFLSASGEALTSPKETVRSVKPGETVRRTVAMAGLASGQVGDTAENLPVNPGSDLAGDPSQAPSQDLSQDPPRGATRVRILQVRSIPTTEEPSTGGACPPSGVRLYADEGDAAMGLRVVGLRLENCGTRNYPLNGYPDVALLGEDHAPVTGVRVLDGPGGIATGTGADGVPAPVNLKPGERAHATLVWRNTTEAGLDAVHAPYARVRAKPGTDPVTVTSEFDLGTTGRLGVGPWKPLEEGAGRPRP